MPEISNEYSKRSLESIIRIDSSVSSFNIKTGKKKQLQRTCKPNNNISMSMKEIDNENPK